MADERKRRGRRDRDNEERKSRRDRDREESGDDPKRHASVIERRWLGSPPPTPELYARALQQWEKLPGAVSRPASDVTGGKDEPATLEANRGATEPIIGEASER